MAKKSLELVEAIDADKSADVGRFEISPDVVAFAAGLGIDLGGSLDDRADRAAEHMNRSQRHMLASGLLLASMKASCQHGEFMQLIEERGFEDRAARKAVQYAQFIVSRPEGERALLMGLPKSKVLALASADDDVIEHMLADGGQQLESLSVRGLMDKLRDQQAAVVDLTTQRDTAEAQAEALRLQLTRRADREDKVPFVVADLRGEIAAHTKAAQLAVGAFHTIGMDVVALGAAGAPDWKDGTLRLAVAALTAIRLQTEGLLAQYLRELPLDDTAPTTLSGFTRQEAEEAAERFKALTQAHEYAKDLRQWEREQAQPKGKGRPEAKPKAPKGVKA